MKIKRIMTILLSLLSLTGCAAPVSQNYTYRQISMSEVITMMEKEKEPVRIGRAGSCVVALAAVPSAIARGTNNHRLCR